MIEISTQYLEQIRSNKRIRQKLAFEDPLWFSLLYLGHHFKYPFAPFHMEMFHLMRQTEINLIVVMAFRESGKSTILNMTNILWSILGRPEKKLVIIFSKTQEQAKNHFANIKYELENNELLKEDFGPFTDNERGWNKLSLELEYHGSKIMSVTREQSIRGIKYNQYRPDLIICDDMEDFSSITNPTESGIVYNHFESEITAVGSNTTRIIVLGNLISKESLIMKLRIKIGANNKKAIFRAYPLLDDRNKNLWVAKFPNQMVLGKLSAKAGEVWGREYLLNATILRAEKMSEVFKGYSKEDIKLLNDKCREIYKQYGDMPGEILQKPLINQMKKFKITAPILEDVILRPGHPDYEQFIKYQKGVFELATVLSKIEKNLAQKDYAATQKQ